MSIGEDIMGLLIIKILSFNVQLYGYAASINLMTYATVGKKLLFQWRFLIVLRLQCIFKIFLIQLA